MHQNPFSLPGWKYILYFCSEPLDLDRGFGQKSAENHRFLLILVVFQGFQKGVKIGT